LRPSPTPRVEPAAIKRLEASLPAYCSNPRAGRGFGKGLRCACAVETKPQVKIKAASVIIEPREIRWAA
jgi:hypothetical protein